MYRRLEEMAKELEQLRNQKHEDGTHLLLESPSMPGSSHDSPDNPVEHSFVAVLDSTGLEDAHFYLDEFSIDTSTVLEIFNM